MRPAVAQAARLAVRLAAALDTAITEKMAAAGGVPAAGAGG